MKLGLGKRGPNDFPNHFMNEGVIVNEKYVHGRL